ncbi:MAG: tetraacyldisaccharide 4'-kinase [Bdellovibrionia bacterium]
MKAGRTKKPTALLQSVLIGAGSSVLTTLSTTARFLSSVGILKRKKLNARVISVGNIQIGGAGKTPLVAQIANEAAELGLKTCILIRGYKGTWESKGGILFPDGPRANARESGDEAALLQVLCPNTYIGVGASRYRQYQKVLAKAESLIDLVILDDGFQNWRIEKDLEIVALTSAKPWQVLFRDKTSAVKNANLLIWTKGDEEPITYGLPRVRVRFLLAPVQNIPVWLVTGVADEESVYLSALHAGYQIVKRIPFEDHARYGRDTVQKMLVQAQSENCRIAITGKDWVKWRDLGVLKSEIVVLELNLVFEEGRELWSKGLWGQSVL